MRRGFPKITDDHMVVHTLRNGRYMLLIAHGFMLLNRYCVKLRIYQILTHSFHEELRQHGGLNKRKVPGDGQVKVFSRAGDA